MENVKGLFKKVSLLISLQTFTARTGNTLSFTGGVKNSFAHLTPVRKQERMGEKKHTIILWLYRVLKQCMARD